jgi:hypothetical protein
VLKYFPEGEENFSAEFHEKILGIKPNGPAKYS